MEIKGTAVKSILSFVKDEHPDRYTEWLNALPADSKAIMSDAILATHWYPLLEAAVIPTKHLKIFYGGDEEKAAWESGRYSAKNALTGIYKVFVRLSSPRYIIDRASKIFSTYYRPADLKLVTNEKLRIVVHIIEFPQPDRMVENRIAGWMEKAMELNKGKNVKVSILKSMTTGEAVTAIEVIWD